MAKKESGVTKFSVATGLSALIGFPAIVFLGIFDGPLIITLSILGVMIGTFVLFLCDVAYNEYKGKRTYYYSENREGHIAQ